MIRRPPRSTQSRSSAASDVYKRQPLRHGLWPVEGEDLPRPGLRITAVGEPRNGAGALVDIRQRRLVVDPLERRRGIVRRLLLNRGELVTLVVALGLDNADGLLTDKQRVVGRTDVGLILANGNP